MRIADLLGIAIPRSVPDAEPGREAPATLEVRRLLDRLECGGCAAVPDRELIALSETATRLLMLRWHTTLTEES